MSQILTHLKCDKLKNSDKSQEQAKQGQIFLHLMLFPTAFLIGEGVKKHIGKGGGTGCHFPRGSAGISRRKSSKPTGYIDQNLKNTMIF